MTNKQIVEPKTIKKVLAFNVDAYTNKIIKKKIDSKYSILFDRVKIYINIKNIKKKE